MVIAYKTNPEKIVGDTMKHINSIKKYDEQGRLIYHHDYLSNNLKKYKYDKKGRVTEYFEEFIGVKTILHFAASYTKKGAFKSVTNLDKTKRADKISYYAGNRTLLISSINGYSYNYTTDKKGRLSNVKATLYNSTTYNSTLLYNKKGELIKEEGKKDVEGLIASFTTTFEFLGGNLKAETEETTVIGSKKTTTLKTNYLYLLNTLLKKVIDSDIMKIETTYAYDKQNRLKQAIYISGGMALGEEQYVYR
jgi:YD repeat-containing protein